MDYHEIERTLHSIDEENRRSVLNLLGDLPLSQARALLFSAMGDASWRVRKKAVECYSRSTPDSESIAELLALLRNEENAGLRNSAAEAVARLGSAAIEPLLTAVADTDAHIRKFVIDVMGAIGDPIFVPKLLEALHDPDEIVAATAAEQLGGMGTPGVAAPLLETLLSRDEVLFRMSALGTLGRLACPIQVTDSLAQLADQDVLKKALFECLGAVADESAFKLLLDGFSSRRKNCRASAVTSVHRIYRRSSAESQEHMREALQLLKENDIITGLLELFDGDDIELKDALFWAAVEIGDARFIPKLIDATAIEMTTEAAFAALKCFGTEALHEFDGRYSALGESGRAGLCMFIAECGYSGCNHIIRTGLSDASPLVRCAAAEAVGTLGLVTLIPELVALIDDSDLQVCQAAATGLGALALISRAAIISEVNRFTASDVPHHRATAARLLASLGERDRLQLLMKDEDPHVRKAAVSALGASGSEAGGALLVLALADEEPDVRIAVAEALGVLRDFSTLNALEHALNDDDIWVQSTVLKSIARIDSARVLALISGTYGTMEGLLLITSLIILEEINSRESEALIRTALSHSDPDVARQASRSLNNMATRL